MRKRLGLLALLLPLAASAAQNTALCNNAEDGGEHDAVPYGSYDANNCLVIPTGTAVGGGSIKFQYKYINRPGTSKTVTSGDCNIVGVKVGSGAGSTDPDKTILWDHVTWDGYNSKTGNQATGKPYNNSCMETDPIFTGKSDHKYSYQYWLLKSSIITNYVDCGQAATFGPPSNRNLFTCTSDSSHHGDSIQWQGQPTDAGYAVIQDSQIVNNIHSVRVQANPVSTALGDFAIQGTLIGAIQASGLADHWITDCLAAHASDADHLCTAPEMALCDGPTHPEMWLVNVSGTATTSCGDTPPAKTIVVNQNCGPSGCHQGSITYHNGWPHPLDYGSSAPDTPNSCPNGLIDNGHGNTYCYTSIEAAVAAGHTLFPFAKLSCEGWATPPPECGGGGIPPALGIVTTVTTPVTTGSAHTITAAPSGGTGLYTVTYDCDADGAYDDGSQGPSSGPFSKVCPAFGTPGTRSVGAKVTDALFATASDNVSVIVQNAIVCGDGVVDFGEVCDPGAIPPPPNPALNGLSCQSPQFAYTGGTLKCKSDCSDYDLTSCTGPPVISCGDDQCVSPENATTCYHDCEFSVVNVLKESLDGMNYASLLFNGIIIDLATANQQHYTIDAESFSGATSAYRFIWDNDQNSPYSQIQNTPLYSLCGDTGNTVDTALPCNPAWTRGTHTLEVQPCNVNFSGTFNVPPYTDARCTGVGGTLGKKQTFTFTVIYTQFGEFFHDSIRLGMREALLQMVARR